MSKISAAFRAAAAQVAKDMEDVDLRDSFKLPCSDSGIVYNLILTGVEADVGFDRKTKAVMSHVRLNMRVLDGEFTGAAPSFYFQSNWGWLTVPLLSMAAAAAQNPKILTDKQFVEAASILAGFEGRLCAEFVGVSSIGKGGKPYKNYTFNRIIEIKPASETSDDPESPPTQAGTVDPEYAAGSGMPSEDIV